MSGSSSTNNISIQGRVDKPGEVMSAENILVGPSYPANDAGCPQWRHFVDGSVRYHNSSRDPSGHWDSLGLSATRLMKSQLYAVGAADALSYIIAALILVSVPFSRGFCPRAARLQ